MKKRRVLKTSSGFRLFFINRRRTFLGTINFSPSAETNVTVSSDDAEAEVADMI